MIPSNAWLIAGGVLSSFAAALHLACIVGGASWYRFLGAGERMARMVEQGQGAPHLITLAIAVMLAIWGAYAFSGAGLIRRLPLLRTGLIVISAIYLARGAVLVKPALLRRPDLPADFIFWSSSIVLVIGLAYAIGTWTAWPYLSAASAR